MCDRVRYWNETLVCNNYPCVNSTCQCGGDMMHDLTLFRQRDCLMNRKLMLSSVAICFIVYTALLIWGLTKYQASMGTARLLLQFCYLWIMVVLTILLSFCLNEYHMTAFGLVLYGANVQSAICMCYFIIYSFASPLYKMANASETNMRRGLIVMYIIFTVLVIIALIPAIVLYGDSQEEENDHGWNLWLSIYSFINFAQIVLMTALVFVTGRQMVRLVESVMEKTPDGPNKVITEKYVQKVKKTIKFFPTFGPVYGLAIIIPPISHLSTGYMPYCHVFISMTLLSNMFSMYFFISYASNKKATEEAEEEQQQQAQQQHQQQQQRSQYQKVEEDINNDTELRLQDEEETLSKAEGYTSNGPGLSQYSSLVL